MNIQVRYKYGNQRYMVPGSLTLSDRGFFPDGHPYRSKEIVEGPKSGRGSILTLHAPILLGVVHELNVSNSSRTVPCR